jgi:hypothetical protein
LLLRQVVRFASHLALAKTGSSLAVKIAVMAMTTNSSISVNARAMGTHTGQCIELGNDRFVADRLT